MDNFIFKGIRMKTLTLDKPISLLFFTLIMAGLLSVLEIVSVDIQLLGSILIAFTLFVFITLLIKQDIYIDQIKMFTPYFLMILLYVFNLRLWTTDSAINNIIFYITYGLFFFVVININWKRYHFKLFHFASYVGLFILLIYTLFDLSNINTNRIGIISFVLTFYPLIYIIKYKNKKKSSLLFLFLLSGTIIFISGSRSVMIAIAFMLLTITIWKLITANKLFFKLYFLAISFFVAGYTIIYPNLHRLLTNFDYYQYLMIKYTGKAIYSGRNVIWDTLLKAISEKPYLGHGTGALAAHFLGTEQSAHNLYLEITLQIGIVGLALFTIFLYMIWKQFWIKKHDPTVILGASFFVALIVHQTNEVLLIKNSVPINFMIWLAFGLVISHIYNTPLNR